MDELERALVGRTSLVDAIEPAQRLGARCVQIVVRVELEAVDQCERSLDLARFGHGCGLVQLHDRRAGSAGELVVESRELRPVLGLLDVQGRDGRLEHVGVAAAERERTVERGSSLRDLVEIPARAILVAKQDDRAVGATRASRRASLISMSASKACTSGSSGTSSASARPSRIASTARSPRPP